MTRSNIGRVIKQNITETLTEINPQDGKITPRRATSWKQISPTRWKFTLRKRVRFHDGSMFTARSAVEAIRRNLDPSMDCEVRTKFFGGMKITARSRGGSTLIIDTDQPNPILPTMMGIMPMTAAGTPMGKPTRNPVGSGPYTLERWTVGREVVLKRFDGYWGKKPEVERARYVWRSESTVRAVMVGQGEADIAPNIAVQDAGRKELDFSYPNSETSKAAYRYHPRSLE